jgi:hypothetical protein
MDSLDIFECKEAECPKYHVKYPTCAIQALWENGHGWADASTGNSCEWFEFAYLYLFRESGTVRASEWSGEFDIEIPAGTYLVISELSSGQVVVAKYPGAIEAESAFDEIERAYERSGWAHA